MTHQECTCLSNFNEMLKEHNTEIDITFSIPRNGGPMRAFPKIATSKIESRKRVGPVIAAPTFCPFCGQRYEPKAAVPAQPTIQSRMVDASVRIQGMWPFPVWPAPSALGGLFEFADDVEMPSELMGLLSAMPAEIRDALFDAHDSDFGEAFEELCARATDNGLSGYVGIAASPILRTLGNGGVEFSWGYYDTKVIFGRTAEAFLETATAWGEERFAAASQSPRGAA